MCLGCQHMTPLNVQQQHVANFRSCARLLSFLEAKKCGNGCQGQTIASSDHLLRTGSGPPSRREAAVAGQGRTGGGPLTTNNPKGLHSEGADPLEHWQSSHHKSSLCSPPWHPKDRHLSSACISPLLLRTSRLKYTIHPQ
eukprot:320493-Pelagomonas_calceolata.AAC.4